MLEPFLLATLALRRPLSSQSDALASFRSIGIQADPSLWKEALKSSIIFLILSPHSNQQSDMLHRVYRDEKVAEIPAFKDILKLYITHEIIR